MKGQKLHYTVDRKKKKISQLISISKNVKLAREGEEWAFFTHKSAACLPAHSARTQRTHTSARIHATHFVRCLISTVNLVVAPTAQKTLTGLTTTTGIGVPTSSRHQQGVRKNEVQTTWGLNTVACPVARMRVALLYVVRVLTFVFVLHRQGHFEPRG